MFRFVCDYFGLSEVSEVWPKSPPPACACGSSHAPIDSQTTFMVTLIPRLPLSAKNLATEVSNTRQSLFIIAD